MEFSKTWLPDLNRPGMRTDDKVQAINEYLISLDKQIRHVLSNLDEDNFSDALIKNLNATSEKIREIEESMTSAAPPTSGGGGSFEGELPIASETQAGIMKVGSNLKVTASGVVSVDTAAEAEEGNTKPITSAAARAAVDSVSAVLYGKAQSLTDEQKAQARENIGVTSIPFSHSWEGTVLSVTSGSGTSSADLQGPRGEDGADGSDGDDGVGIASVMQTTSSTSDGGKNVMTVTLTNGTTSTFTVYNGKKGSTGSGITMKKLWTNASPTSSFAAQTVSVALASYDMYAITYKFLNTNAMEMTQIARVGSNMNLTSNDSANVKCRFVTYASGKLTFTTGYNRRLSTDAVTEDATQLIPVCIYGIDGIT